MAATYVPPENIDPPQMTRMEVALRALMYPPWLDRALNRLRGTVIVESSGTVSQVTTVASVTNQVNIDSIQGRLLPLSTQVSAWSACVRSRIS